MSYRRMACPICQKGMYGDEAATADERAGECFACWTSGDAADAAADDFSRGRDFEKGIQANRDSEQARRHGKLTPFSKVHAKPVRWLWRDRIPLAKITALAGRPKIGKGLLWSRIAADVTTGALDGDLDGPRDVIVLTTEDDAASTLKPRLQAAGAHCAHVHALTMSLGPTVVPTGEGESVPFRVPGDALELKRLVQAVKAALVIVDPLIEVIAGTVDTHKSHPVRQAIAALNAVAQEACCAVLVVFHLNKSQSTDPLMRHEGSAAFTQVVRGGLLLGPDPEDPAGERGARRVLASTSSNLGALASSLKYEIVGTDVQGADGEAISTARLDYMGESRASGSDLLASPQTDGEQDAPALQEAVDFLRDELADGPLPSDEVQSTARKVGISIATLRRAKSSLGVRSIKAGREGWKWTLVEGAHGGDEHLQNPGVEHLPGFPANAGDSGATELEGAHLHEREHLPAKAALNGHDPDPEQPASRKPIEDAP